MQTRTERLEPGSRIAETFARPGSFRRNIHQYAWCCGAILVLAVSSIPRLFSQETKTNFFLPQNPVAAAYVLGRLSNQEMIAAPRGEFVYVALLQRAGLEKKYRLEALDGLARLRQSDPLAELLKALAELDRKGEAAVPALRDLGTILVQWKPADLATKRSELENLSTQSQLTLTREISTAGVIISDHSMEKSWDRAGTDPARLGDLLNAAAMIRDSEFLTNNYARIAAVLQHESAPETRKAAIKALATVPGHETDTFKILAGLAASGVERTAAIAGLERIPQNAWPKPEAASLLKALLDYLRGVAPADRSSEDFAQALQLATTLSGLFPDEKATSKELRSLGPTFIVLHAVYEQLRYDKNLFVVEAGKPVILTLQNDDAMPHNVAILSPGALEEIGTAAEKMSTDPDSQGRLYVPPSPKVLQATKLAAPGQKVQLAFSAPDEPGEYPYVCTFPGHWRRMVGTMITVKDVDAYLATHPQSEQPKLTEWKIEDLAAELAKNDYPRSPENGKKLFTQLACVQCHKLGSEGYAFGPDLTEVLAKYKSDRSAVLQQILEPSKSIEDRYRNFNFDLKSGEPVLGLILKEDAQNITIQTGPADSLVQTLNKSEIVQRKRLDSSPMPVGLLNALSKEQILDLISYLESGGKPATHEHSR